MTSEGPQAERIGQTLLANQFVTGLRPDLKRKLIGTEGSLEELVLRARFEEAKTRELMGDKPRSNVPSRTQNPPTGPPYTSAPPKTTSYQPASTTQKSSPAGARSGSRLKCYNCGLDGHMARNCPYPKRGRRDEEVRAPATTQEPVQTGTPQKTISALVGEDSTRTKVNI